MAPPFSAPECPEGAFRCGECKGSWHAYGVTEGLLRVRGKGKGPAGPLPQIALDSWPHSKTTQSKTG